MLVICGPVGKSGEWGKLVVEDEAMEEPELGLRVRLRLIFLRPLSECVVGLLEIELYL